MGIPVLWTRYRNVILGGLVAGIGGAFLTVGSVGTFNPDISSGFGYIALAALIFGRWTPLGSLAAALAVRLLAEARDGPALGQLPLPPPNHERRRRMWPPSSP